MAERLLCCDDFRRAARRRLPRIIYDYIAGGSFDQQTLARNTADFSNIELRQRVLRDVSNVSLATQLFGRTLAMPLLLAPVGMAGMTARRGEVQAARAARNAGIPFCLSTTAICPIEEVAAPAGEALWFQLYMMRDRGYMRDLLARAKEAGVEILVFTVDLPVPGVRRRFNLATQPSLAGRVGLALDCLLHPAWLIDVGLRGRPHVFGNIAPAVDKARRLSDFWGWIRDNGDASVTWEDIAWLRQHWDGPIVIKGILDAADALRAVEAGAEGIVVSNHGGRQLDGTCSSISALPSVIRAIEGRASVLIDGGIRSGIDVLKALALGADACLIGRPWAYALAAEGERGVARLIGFFAEELRTAMALTGIDSIAGIDESLLRQEPFADRG